jgi:hypothetical protein
MPGYEREVLPKIHPTLRANILLRNANYCDPLERRYRFVPHDDRVFHWHLPWIGLEPDAELEVNIFGTHLLHHGFPEKVRAGLFGWQVRVSRQRSRGELDRPISQQVWRHAPVADLEWVEKLLAADDLDRIGFRRSGPEKLFQLALGHVLMQEGGNPQGNSQLLPDRAPISRKCNHWARSAAAPRPIDIVGTSVNQRSIRLVGGGMHNFENIRQGARLRGFDPAGIAEIVQVARFGPDALNLAFRVDGRAPRVPG